MAASTTSTSSFQQSDQWAVKQVLGEGREHRMKIVGKFFDNLPQTLYGNAKKRFEEIKNASDKCRLLYKNSKPEGILVYQRTLSNEYNDWGMKKGLEVKMLSSIELHQDNIDKDLLGALLNEVKTEAKKQEAQSILITVPKVKAAVVDFFRKKGFQVLDGKQNDLYVLGLFLAEPSGSTHRSEELPRESLESRKRKDPDGKQEVHPTEPAVKKAKPDLLDELKQDYKEKYPGPTYSEELEFYHRMRSYDERNNASHPASLSYPQNSGYERRDPDYRRHTVPSSSQPSSYDSSRQTQTLPFYVPIPNISSSSTPTSMSRSMPKPTEVTLPKKYIHQIRNGEKTIEGRINSGMFKDFKEGQYLRFFYKQNPHDDVICRITRKKTYKSFEEMLSYEDIGACLPGITDRRQAVAEYHNIPGYQEKAKRSGVIAFHIAKVK